MLCEEMYSSCKTAGEVAAVMLGTTQLMNALVQRRGLQPVALLRLCGPATRALPPGIALPSRLRQAILKYTACVGGGYGYDGGSVISEVNEGELRLHMRDIMNRDVSAIVVAGVFSPVNSAQEQAAVAILQDEEQCMRQVQRTGKFPETYFYCASHTIGYLGLLERENAAVLNAALHALAGSVVAACTASLQAVGIASAPLFFTSNDGTLLSTEAAKRMPISLLKSGPINSLRGAGALALRSHWRVPKEAIVLDVGGTTTDVGVLENGLPRPSARAVTLAGVMTNYQMPDVTSVGLVEGPLSLK